MSNVLAAIVNYKRQLVTNSQDVVPTEKSTRSLKQALSKPEFGFIMECKKASPSKGLIRESFDLTEIVPIYNQYADAISVLTEERFFQGSYKNLEYVAKNTNKPVLCKDFILEPKQIRQARYYGADAILLMLSVLSDEEYRICAEEAIKYQLDILTEVHDKTELQRAIDLGAEIIGVNNRDLKDLSTSLDNTKQLFDSIPKDRVIVTESGINSHQDVMELSQYADSCLVGSSLMSKEKLEIACAELVYGDIKICGLTNQQDLSLVDKLATSSIGVIFADKSKRKVEQLLSVENKPLIGVFQNQTMDFILNKITEYQLNGLQLHGDESQTLIDELRQELGNDFFISKVVHVNGALPDFDYKNLSEILLDTQLKEQQGGTGEAFDWRLLESEAIQTNKAMFRIAGGLDADNVAQLKSLGFSKLDICSGSESAAGIKCPNKLDNLFKNCKVKGFSR